MAYEFTEDLQVLMPQVQGQVAEVTEAVKSKNHKNGLIVEIAAIHEGLTNNFNYYTKEALENSLTSWTSPFPKPVILNHDVHSEAVGRVIGAELAEEDDGTPFIRLQAAITDPQAIEKVMDQRYLTGSVGGASKEAICNICGTDWAAPPPKEMRLPCRHTRGRVYEGTVAHIKQNFISFKEYSFVNMPSDERSSIRGHKLAEADMAAARVFSLDMDEEAIMEFSESRNPENVLEKMRNKQASYYYNGLKGAFLLASAVQERLEEEDTMSDTEHATEASPDEDDVLAAASRVSEELKEQNKPTEADPEDAGEGSGEDGEPVPTQGSDGSNTGQTDDGSPEDGADADDKKEESDEASEEAPAEGEGGKADDAEPSDDAPAEDPSDDNSPGADDAQTDQTEDGSPEEATKKKDDDKPELDEVDPDKAKAVRPSNGRDAGQTSDGSPKEAEIAALQERVAKLEEENAKYKAALHRTLAERVVDTKIAVGLVDAATREDAIEEHSNRTASSLADSLRDLVALNQVKESTTDTDSNGRAVRGLEISPETQVVEKEKGAVTIVEDSEEEPPSMDTLSEEELRDLFIQRMTSGLLGRESI